MARAVTPDCANHGNQWLMGSCQAMDSRRLFTAQHSNFSHSGFYFGARHPFAVSWAHSENLSGKSLWRVGRTCGRSHEHEPATVPPQTGQVRRMDRTNLRASVTNSSMSRRKRAGSVLATMGYSRVKTAHEGSSSSFQSGDSLMP